MKKLILALTLTTLGTASLCAMASNTAKPTANTTVTTTTTTSSVDAIIAAIEANVDATNTTATAKKDALTWIKNHKLLISTVIVTLVGSFAVCHYYGEQIKAGLRQGGSLVANQATGAWTTAKNNPKIAIPAAAAVVIAAISADLLRGENSWIKKTFSKKQAA